VKSNIEFLFNKFGIVSGRTKNITKHVVISFVYKGGNIVVNFLLVPLIINLLDTENYGIWLTLSSFISWFSFFDVGLGHGLRNKFAEAKAKGDLSLVKAYISTAYYTIGTVCLLLIVLFWTLNFFIDWTRLFNTSTGLKNDLGLLMPIVFSFFCLQLLLNLITTIYTADQHHSMQGKVTFYGSALSLLSIWLMSKLGENSLLIFGILFSALPVLILLGLNIFAFSYRYKVFKPTIELFRKHYLKDIFGLGMKFFIIQLSGIILFSTDNFIITQLFGPKEVVPFNVAFKYLSISSMILSMILAPYWSSITEAYIKGDFEWIKVSMKNLFKISTGVICMVFLMVLLSSFAYRYWIGSIVVIPFSLTFVMAIYFSVTLFYSPYTYFVNGIGKVKLQMYSIALTSLLNIPLSIFFAKIMGLGVQGIILATIICLIPHAILSPIQYWKIINNKACGIFND
jgi:O-antigen/teichoic acid export membrane protein